MWWIDFSFFAIIFRDKYTKTKWALAFVIPIHYVQSTHVYESPSVASECTSMFTIQDFKQCIKFKSYVLRNVKELNELRYV